MELPTIGNMIKLVVFLGLALIALSIGLAILAALLPVVIIGLLVMGGLYLYRSLTHPEKA